MARIKHNLGYNKIIFFNLSNKKIRLNQVFEYAEEKIKTILNSATNKLVPRLYVQSLQELNRKK